MDLYFLRHGDAVEDGFDDASRPLSSIGEEQARFAANALRRLEAPPEIILSSPLTRAMQMARIVQEALDIKKVGVTEYLIPGTDLQLLIREIHKLAPARALLVGHEPLLSGFISLLISGAQNSRVEMKKGSLACLEAAPPIKPGTCTLKWLLTPDQMK